MSTDLNEIMDQMPENNPESGQTGKGQHICNVCAKMMERLSSLPSYTQLPSGINTIGKLDPTSNCTIHPELLNGFLPERPPTTCEIAADNDEPGLCISFRERFYPESKFNLVKHSAGGSNIGHGRVNDPSWIDSRLIRQWKDKCCTTHDSKCGQTLASGRLPASHVVWLVDTHKYCLVPVQSRYQYVAFSYIWGTKKMLMTQRSNLTELQKEQALSTGPLAHQVARAIRDSIELVKLLGERYLWVDALCIVQDDGASKHHQITNMSSIYAAAKLTIISAQASNAWHGLRGLENISEPRSLHVRTVSAGGYRFVERLKYTTGLMPWCQRGWTFQEALFSPRRLIFSDDSVQWSCGTVVWTEDLDYDHKPRLLGSSWGVNGEAMLNTAFPDLTGLNQLVETYGAREFTFPEDTLSAFAGFSTAISNIFLGGFIQGLPIMFLDAALLWKSDSFTQWPRPSSRNKVYRKVPSKAQGECPPTWSWAGWATAVDGSSWAGASDYIRYSKTMRFSSDKCRTEPAVRWYAREKKESEPKFIPYQNEWFKYRQRFLNREEGDLPPGWTRLKSDSSMAKGDQHFHPWNPPEETPAFYYVHNDAPDTQFWYPIPIIKSSQTSSNCQFGRYLSCRTQKSLFWTEPSGIMVQGKPDMRILHWANQPFCPFPEKFTDGPLPIYLRDQSGLFAGYLIMHAAISSPAVGTEGKEGEATEEQYTHGSRLHGRRELKNLSGNVENQDSFTARQTHKEQPFQVVAISKGRAFPKSGEDYDFINVLWVEWVDGIAYRKGLGRIFQHVWERQPLEDIELILG
ncbi:hypothetical protein CEP54_008218 [Fusarium duplospermum]|uniref:Heterokaryon incompatibility domain-containing protein n=1 Tax=Fusarium duplospermum TaxID=1325734 RepID=A0A428PX25_9HYPO|nr:hypothetical protein CEP54_008218 [Fusarium duplospermum]